MTMGLPTDRDGYDLRWPAPTGAPNPMTEDVRLETGTAATMFDRAALVYFGPDATRINIRPDVEGPIIQRIADALLAAEAIAPAPASSNADVGELERLDAAATAGPWTREKPGKDADGWGRGVVIAAVYGGEKIYADPPGGQMPSADANLIVALRNTALPIIRRLLSSLQAAEARVAELEADQADDVAFLTELAAMIEGVSDALKNPDTEAALASLVMLKARSAILVEKTEAARQLKPQHEKGTE